MPTSPTPQRSPRGRHCPDCQAFRLHRLRLSAEKVASVRIRVLACTGCERETPIEAKVRPGISCPKCANVTFEVVYTRHRIGATMRVKRCKNPRCRHRIRTSERVESFAS